MPPKPSITEIESLSQLVQLSDSSPGLVFTHFYTGQDDPKLVETLQSVSALPQFSRSQAGPPKLVKVNVDTRPEIAAAYKVTNPPRIVILQRGSVIFEMSYSELAGELGGEPSTSGGESNSRWLGAELPRNYKDITDQIEMKRVELLNVDGEKGGVRVLFSETKPSALRGGKGTEVDWVESDTDEQLLLFMPFQSMVKVHTLQITSVPPTGEDFDEDETPMRPKTLKLFHNRPTNMGFDQAETTAPTQVIEISEGDWNAEGTANIALRFVKFQNIQSLVIFVESGDGSSEKVRLDRVRLIGETGEKREMGKLEKIGDEPGE